MEPMPFLDHGYQTFQLRFHPNLNDISPMSIGYSVCGPNTRCIRERPTATLIHYVYRGKGKYFLNGVTYEVHAGQAFITLPHANAVAISDEEDPWTIAWVSFTGILSSDFKTAPPVVETRSTVFPHLQNLQNPSPYLEYEIATDLLALYSALIAPSIARVSSSSKYVQSVIDYIAANFSKNLTIEQIANHVGLNRTWLSVVFRKETGTNIRTHLKIVRLQEARRLLLLGFGVAETADKCGFPSAENFSRQFKAYSSLSPLLWKKQYQKNHPVQRI